MDDYGFPIIEAFLTCFQRGNPQREMGRWSIWGMWDESALTSRGRGFARIASGGSGIPGSSGVIIRVITSARCTGSASSTPPPPAGLPRASGPGWFRL